MTRVLVEACVSCVEESLSSVQAGAGRLELCSDLHLGGLTPPVELVRAVRPVVEVPIHAMVRLRAGSYAVGAEDVTVMARLIQDLLDAGADGIVVGVLNHAGKIDGAALSALVTAAGSRSVTFHRAFDEVPDQLAALETLRRTGVSRVLTSGGEETAWEGRDTLRRLVEAAGDGITILGGGGVRGDHAVALARYAGLAEVHARASAVPELALALS